MPTHHQKLVAPALLSARLTPDEQEWITKNIDMQVLRVYPGRWGSIAGAVRELGKLEEVLTRRWSKAKYNFNGDEEQLQQFNNCAQRLGSDEVADENIVDKAIHSKVFWSYRRMKNHLASTLDHFLYWCESCDCHHHLRQLHTVPGEDPSYSKPRRRKYFRDKYGVKRCPLAGCRAAAFANGRWRSTLASCFRVSASTVDLSVDAGVSVADRASIRDDFDRARHHIELACTIKLMGWQHLPLRAAGMADSSEADARARALLRYWRSTRTAHTNIICTGWRRNS
jgi:hypothetical protein